MDLVNRFASSLHKHLRTFRCWKRENRSQEFDECDGCSYDDQKARLDNLAVELQSDRLLPRICLVMVVA
jgi:hypothetical protein